jgi:hypothetical protein
MSQTKQERNKALVLEAFDTLFNKRDYVAAKQLQRHDRSGQVVVQVGRDVLFGHGAPFLAPPGLAHAQTHARARGVPRGRPSTNLASTR